MSENFILKGPEPVISLLDENLGELFFKLLSSKNPASALIDAQTCKKLSYEDLFENSRRLAFYLQQQGYKKNDIFAISSENNLEFFVIILACFYLGITVAPLNPDYTSTELTKILSIFKPCVIFCTMKNLATFKKLDFDLKIITINEIGKIFDLTKDWKKLEPLKDNPKDLNAFILCSSGTTGLPKGVILSHTNILTRLSHHKDHRYYRQEPEKTIFPVLPFFHGYGLLAGLGGILLQLKIVFLNRFEERLFLNTIESFKVDYLWVTPPLLVFLAKSPLVKNFDVSSVKEILCGAAPLGKPIEKEIRKRFKARFSQGYGMTETTFAMALSSYLKPLKDGSCGQVTPFMYCKIKDPTSDNSLPPNKIGELCIKGKQKNTVPI